MVREHHGHGEAQNSSATGRPQASGESDAVACRVKELERDQFRLQRLVTELLMKNQRLRASLERLTVLFGSGVAPSKTDEQWS